MLGRILCRIGIHPLWIVYADGRYVCSRCRKTKLVD